MIKRTIHEIASMMEVMELTAMCDAPEMETVQGVSIDSRTLQAGNLFVPIVRIDDGHRYVKKAFEQGAAASLWQADHVPIPEDLPLIIVEDTLQALQRLAQAYRSQLNVKVIGITGSNGKTTVKDMVASILSTNYTVHKTHGNLNGEYGLPLSLLDVEETTEVVVLEMGMSHAGEMKVLSEIARPDVGVITMIGVSHLSNLGSRAGIALAKLEILEGLHPAGALIIHGDEPLLAQALAERNLPATLDVIRFGEASTNDYVPLTIEHHQTGFTVTMNKHNEAFSVPLLGGHNVWNVLAAIAVADRFQIPLQDMQAGLAHAEITGMRMERIAARRGFLMINDAWNASPVSMKAAIETVSNLDGFQRRVLVLGDMLELGEAEHAFHEELARSIDPSRIHVVYTIGNLSRILSDTLRDSDFTGEVEHFTAKEELVAACRRLLKPDDVLLVKGSRGLKLEEVCEALKQCD
ncbi:UDP-N-acetylmuramoyl-tripeptide--D-alanyl-D-alanine ligase [Paenibacillus rhizovicinus]|uniref:UDP-N-acetylmuramoyl-tripeptide--D-alanyl-D-alanine ligase n=1 Tax=Paenibacillus rhizovicinus TaxID=2704463 RepID=A0A6C0P950_9BACL|nr:UDP-N-acetylmuramoyl-tripeptide--D-alanyl-D-alanine ligase [Paenibacillus rhizovicinus]QHW33062.1 UDP-N-acetylmuramoyl-tripeptide--D-alanyl-D-alanine ligase [Paenibacillus rhizovicinus]